MTRILHGSVALAAAVALCFLGGAGSMASWQSSIATQRATFTTGHLALTTTPGTWLMNGAAVTPDSRAVPGATLQYTQQFTVDLAGDGLAARVTLDPGAVTAGAFVPGAVTLSAPAVADGDGWLVTSSGAMTLTMDFAWPTGDTADDAMQGESITVDASELLMVQEVPR